MQPSPKLENIPSQTSTTFTSGNRVKIVDFRSLAVGRDFKGRERDGQLEAPRARAAGIEVQDAVDPLDLRYVGMAGNDYVDAGPSIDVERLQVVQNVDSLQSIEIVTVHSSKGLEWPVVIPINRASMPRRTETFVHRRSDESLHWALGQIIPPGLGDALLTEEAEKRAENLRLLYVACTRAMESLKRREREQAKEEAARQKERERRQHAIEKAQNALDQARRKHEDGTADIRTEIQRLEDRLRDEDAKWERERTRLEAVLRRARG